MFLAYAAHEQEKEDIIKAIVSTVANLEKIDEIKIPINLINDLSENDITYIKEESCRRLRRL